MASDLISRAAAIEYLMTNMGWHDDDGYEVDDADEKRKIITDLVNGIPTVDAAPVVRCRDCKFYNTTGCSYGFGWCEDAVVNTGVYDEFYCANGGAIMDGGDADESK